MTKTLDTHKPTAVVTPINQLRDRAAVAAPQKATAPKPPAVAEEEDSISQHDLQTLVMYRRLMRAHRRIYGPIEASIRRKLEKKAEIEDGARYCELAEYVIRGRRVTRLVID